MGQIVPAAIETYLASLNPHEDDILKRVAEEGHRLRLPIIDAGVGLLLQLLARSMAARRILEIGTANGYSAIWMSRALPSDGMLLTIEIDPSRAAIARRNFEAAGLADRATVMVGDAARLIHKVAGPFDLIFNDGDKLQYGLLLDRLVELMRAGGLLVTDNVLWDGEVAPGYVEAPRRPAEVTRAMAAYNVRLANDRRWLTSFLPLRDGLAVALKR